MRPLLEPIIEDAILRKVTPGAVVLVAEGGSIVCHEAFGNTASAEDGGSPVSRDTIYDAASVTKAAVTSSLLMKLVSEGALALDSPVAPLLPELRAPGTEVIELRHLLGHGSGLPAHIHFFERIWAGDLGGAANPRDALVQMAGATPLAYEPGTQTIYSDLGYILLARLIENVAGAPLESLFAERIAGPLGMLDSRFVPVPGEHPEQARVAPSQRYPDRGLLWGQVHDDNCHSGGGICGHAGLFSTAADLAKLAQALCDVHAGRGSFVAGETLRQFWSSRAAPDTSWRMGWDTPSETPGVSHTGDHWPLSGVGHLGFTGTAMYLAPEHNRFVIILSNRVYYSWDKSGIKAMRRALFDAISTALAAL